MTQHVARYATLRFQPYPNRSEHLNYGIVVFLPEGGVRVHLASSLLKLRALSPGQSIAKLRDQEIEIPKIIGDLDQESALSRLNALRVLRNQTIHDLGVFAYSNQAEYSQNIQLALLAQCDVAGPPRAAREQKSRLYLDVKSRFKALGILAATRNEIPDHQVVEHYAPDPRVDLRVEFALQNGLLRVAQTIDLRTGSSDIVSSQNRNTAFSKAYAIHVTRSSVHKVESYVITAGANTDSARKILAPIENDADQILHWENSEEMEGFFTEWAEAAGRPLPAIPLAN